MRNLNVKAFAYCLVFLSIMVWGIVLLFSGVELGWTWDALKKLPTVVTVDLLLWAAFVKCGWKARLFQGWLVPFPDLQGTWRGTLKTTWENPETHSIPPPSDVYLVIRQSFIHVHCKMLTKEMVSQSYAADFWIDKEGGVKRLVYSYVSEPKPSVRNRSAIHNGTAALSIIDRPQRRLRGQYWTDRKTTGEIELEFYGAELVQEMPGE